MGDKTGIDWTDASWNPTTGCDRCSPGCDFCYALTMAARLKAMGQPAYQNDGDPKTSGPGFALTVHWDRLDQPNRWTRPRRIFVDSMSDLFHPDVPSDFLAEVFDQMHAVDRHVYQVLTKRPQRMAGFLGLGSDYFRHWEPSPHIWLGTSIENDSYAFRASHVRAVPDGYRRFLSLEPLLGPLPSLDLSKIDWVIVGAESGPEHRPMELDWVRDLRDRTKAAGAAFYLKQTVDERGRKIHTPELDGRRWEEFPDA